MRSLNAALDSRLTQEEAATLVGAILKQYPNANVNDVYLAGLARVLMRYPVPVVVRAADPADGVPSAIYPFPPVAGELRDWCEEQRRRFLHRSMETVADNIREERERAKAEAAAKAKVDFPRLPAANRKNAG